MNNKDKRFFRALGKSSKRNEWLRPQLIGQTYLFNAPSWLSVAFRFASSFMSKRSMEKVKIHNLKLGERQKAVNRACPFSRQLMGDNVEDALPTFLGGSRAVDDFLYPKAVRSPESFLELCIQRRDHEPL